MSATRNARLAWIAQQLAKGKSNANIVIECVATFRGVSEQVARKDLKAVLQRFTEIENETIEESKTKFLEVGWKLLEETRSVAQYGAAANLFKTLAAISGLLESTKTGGIYAPAGEPGGAISGNPEASVVRDRITALLKNKSVQTMAKESGIDLAVLKKARDEE